MLTHKIDKDLQTHFESEHRSLNILTYRDYMSSSRASSSTPPHTSVKRSHVPRTSSFFVNKSPATSCSFCKSNDHSLYVCELFLKKSCFDKYQFCKSSKLCFNCLSASHDARSCKSRAKCKKCASAIQHTLLHNDKKFVGAGLTQIKVFYCLPH